MAFLHGFVGQTDAGTAIDALFFKPAPPNGMGMQCAALDTYGYAQVTVTARRLRVAMKDENWQPVREATGYASGAVLWAAAGDTGNASGRLGAGRGDSMTRTGSEMWLYPRVSQRRAHPAERSDPNPLDWGSLTIGRAA